MSLQDPDFYASSRAAIDAVHRRPVSLRKWELTSSEGILRGAKLSALIDGLSPESAISVYSILAPELIAGSAQTFLRSPLQILAKLDVLAGGDGKPVNQVSVLQRLAQVIVAQPVELPALVHGMIAHAECFGPRSEVIARAATRLAAVAIGLDPRGLTVPEVYYHRHLPQYRAAIKNFGAHPAEMCQFQLEAFQAGTAEAEAIARLA